MSASRGRAGRIARKETDDMIAALDIRHAVAAAAITILAAGAASAQGSHTSKPFSGSKVNGGTVTHAVQGRMHVLTLSSDFKVPDTPDPHWQVIDTKGQVFLLQRLGIKGDRVNTSITLPAYVTDVARVQIYCAWAEAVLGEAPFASPQKTH
jgi:hypothetical protein